jgi:hypothetical protein
MNKGIYVVAKTQLKTNSNLVEHGLAIRATPIFLYLPLGS